MKKLLFLFLLILIVVPLMSAKPSVVVTTGGLQILAPSYEYYPVATDHDFYWHLFNESKLLTNTSATCDFHLYSKPLKGEHLVVVNNVNTFNNGRDFEVEVKGGNFSTKGAYCVLIECNTSIQTGGMEKCFEVVPAGYELTSQKATIYSIIWIFSLLLLIGLVVLGVSIPVNNKTDAMTGYIIAVSNLKYVKLTCLGLAWAVGIFLSYFTWMLSYAYLDFDFLTSIMQFVFYGMAICTLPMFIFFVYLTIANLVRDSNIAEQLQRGFEVNG